MPTTEPDYRVSARLANAFPLLAALIQTATMLSSAPTDLDDAVHLVVQFLAMVAIAKTALRWPEASHSTRH